MLAIELLMRPDPLATSLSTAGNPQLQELVELAVSRLQLGEPIDVAELTREHPELATELQNLLPTLKLLAALGDTHVSGTTKTTAAAKEGQLLGDFRIIRELARGGMGVVYLAEQVSLGRQVALKILPLAAKLDERQLERFLAEARTVAALQHEHIVPVFAVGGEEGVNYYAMQLISGRSLLEVINQWKEQAKLELQHSAGDFPSFEQRIRKAAEWTIQAADALDYSHTRGIVHRDIKPANLLIDDAGKLWVTDFGVARALTDCNLTITGTLVGTARYMSPEQAGGFQSGISFATDIYSLGATLYELIALAPAYAGNTQSELLRRIPVESPRPVSALERRTPRDLATIIDKAMRPDPAERYPSAQHLADDLARFLHSEPIHALPIGRFTKCVRWMRKRKRAVTAALLVAGLFLVGGFAYARLAEQKYRLEGWRTVKITTTPPGAQLAIVPIDELTNEPNPDPAGIVRPEGRTPLFVDLKPGQYFIEAVLPEREGVADFAEVRRTVTKRDDASSQNRRVAKQKTEYITFRTISTYSLQNKTDPMILVSINDELRVANPVLPESIYIHSREIENESQTYRSAEIAAEEAGSRLPTAAEYDAIVASVSNFTGGTNKSRSSGTPQDMTAGAPEWTSTRYVFPGQISPLAPRTFLDERSKWLILKGYNKLDDFAGLEPTIQGDLVGSDELEYSSIAVRGVRSTEPRFVKQ